MFVSEAVAPVVINFDLFECPHNIICPCPKIHTYNTNYLDVIFTDLYDNMDIKYYNTH